MKKSDDKIESGSQVCTQILWPESNWCKYGVRDPSVLTYPDGTPVINDEKFIIYFNGRDKPISEGGKTRIGRAVVSRNLTITESDKNYVCEDGMYAAQGSVIQVSDDEYWLFYSPDTRSGFIRAISSDGIAWSIDRKNLVRPEQFGCTRIGLPYVTYIGAYWLMLFEGIINNTFRIFAAKSSDGERWEPACSAMTLYKPMPNVWDSLGQANPSIINTNIIKSGLSKYILLYNGHDEINPSGWEIGMLTASDPLNDNWRSHLEPLVRKSKSGWMSGRVEGGRFLDLIDSNTVRILFFGLPSMDSYYGGVIGTTTISKSKLLKIIVDT